MLFCNNIGKVCKCAKLYFAKSTKYLLSNTGNISFKSAKYICRKIRQINHLYNFRFGERSAVLLDAGLRAGGPQHVAAGVGAQAGHHEPRRLVPHHRAPLAGGPPDRGVGAGQPTRQRSRRLPYGHGRNSPLLRPGLRRRVLLQRVEQHGPRVVSQAVGRTIRDITLHICVKYDLNKAGRNA